MEPTRSIERISSDLGRYSVMADYFRKYPERKAPNEEHFPLIALDLMNISEMNLSEEQGALCSDLFDFFYNNYSLCD